jgi:hypothetical protein
MSATMARQGGSVQLEQFDMCLALNMGKISNGKISCTAMDGTHQILRKPGTEVYSLS